MAPHASTLAWKIPWVEEPGRLQSMGSQRVRHNWATKHAAAATKSLQSCVTLWDPIDGRPWGSPVPGILQANEHCIIWNSYAFKRRRQWHPTPVLLPGKSHGQRGLVGCNPWGHWGSDTTERLHFHFSLSCTGEGNGNPFQCSCLEDPRDWGAWWAAVYGVAQSRTTEAT